MYSRQEAALLREKFWTNFGKYLSPILSSEGEKINWINYKTSFKHIRILMDVSRKDASICLHFQHPNLEIQQHYEVQMNSLKPLFEKYFKEKWDWHYQASTFHHQQQLTISNRLDHVSIFRETDWPSIISFLKPRLIKLDEFWSEAKVAFEMIDH